MAKIILSLLRFNTNSEAKALRAANRESKLWHVAGGFVTGFQVVQVMRRVGVGKVSA